LLIMVTSLDNQSGGDKGPATLINNAEPTLKCRRLVVVLGDERAILEVPSRPF
jgi:hypothetical protein